MSLLDMASSRRRAGALASVAGPSSSTASSEESVAAEEDWGRPTTGGFVEEGVDGAVVDGADSSRMESNSEEEDIWSGETLLFL